MNCAVPVDNLKKNEPSEIQLWCIFQDIRIEKNFLLESKSI